MRTLLLLSCVVVAGVTPAVGSPAPAQAGDQGAVPGEALYALPSQEVWALAQGMIGDLGFRPGKSDRTHQVLVTRWRNYDPRILPDAATLGLQDGDRPLRVQFHVMVARDRQPARVAVGSVLEIERPIGGRRATVLGYRPPVLDAWFLATLGARAGVPPEPMPASWQARSERSTTMMPAGLTDPCLAVGTRVMQASASPPVKISDVRPVFPSQGVKSGAGKVLLRGWLTEHGTLTDLTIVSPSETLAHYESSARAAASLWRFQPASVDGCPIAIGFALAVDYTIR